jgi:hypothetical protein
MPGTWGGAAILAGILLFLGGHSVSAWLVCTAGAAGAVGAAGAAGGASSLTGSSTPIFCDSEILRRIDSASVRGCSSVRLFDGGVKPIFSLRDFVCDCTSRLSSECLVAMVRKRLAVPV